MKLEGINCHVRDSRIRFDEEPHIYYIDGIPYDLSVTGFIKEFSEGFDTEQVIARNYSKWQSNKSHKYFGMSIDNIKDLWEENRIDAAKKGSILHRDIELFYNDIDVSNNSKEFQLFLSFFNISKKYTPYRTEWQIFDEEYELAGSVDMSLLDKNNNLILIDWKRSKEIRKDTGYNRSMKDPINHIEDANYWHYALQLNMYKYILEKNYNKIISFMYIIKLHPNQSEYESFHIPDMQKDIKLLLDFKSKLLEGS